MKRTMTVGALVAGGALIVRAIGPRLKLHERLATRCERMFEQLPDTFPPKRAMRGIEEIRVDTARIRELTEARHKETNEPRLPEPSSTQAVRRAG